MALLHEARMRRFWPWIGRGYVNGGSKLGRRGGVKSQPLGCDVTDMRTAPAGAVLISAACLAVGISCR